MIETRERQQTQHTPGPWTVNLEARNSRGGFDGNVFADGPSAVASNVWSEANARLIAAAPELLRTLQSIEQRMDLNGVAQNQYAQFAIGGVAHRAIRAAIARATGQPECPASPQTPGKPSSQGYSTLSPPSSRGWRQGTKDARRKRDARNHQHDVSMTKDAAYPDRWVVDVYDPSTETSRCAGYVTENQENGLWDIEYLNGEMDDRPGLLSTAVNWLIGSRAFAEAA